MVTAYIALGANLGDAARAIVQAVAAINALPQCSVKKTSSLYKTAPLETVPGHEPGGDYVNAVVAIETNLPAPILMLHLQQIERAAGRERPYANAPREVQVSVIRRA